MTTKELPRQRRNLRASLSIARTIYGQTVVPTRADREDQLVTRKLTGDKEPVRNVYSYEAPTVRGDCGSLLLLKDPSTYSRKILGIHLAGNDQECAFAGGLTLDLIDDMESEFTKPDIIFDVQSDLKVAPTELLDVGGTVVSKFIYEKSFPLYSSTNIIRSELYEAWGKNERYPAIMCPTTREGELVDPRAKAVAHYSNHTPHIQHNLLKRAKRDYMSFLLPRLGVGTRTVYDFDTAVKGIDGDPYRNGIPRSTSAGFPYCLEPEKWGKKKYAFFGDGGDYDLSSSECVELRESVNDIIEAASSGKRKLHVYVDFLKDERRSEKKIKNVETRLISACPLALLVCFRMYFLDFVGQMMEKRIRNECAVGANVFGGDWDVMHRALSSKGDKCIAGDYSAFDSSHSPTINYAILDVINEWYNDGNDAIRRVLWEEITNSHHLYGDVIYDWDHSLPSGNPLTSIINSMYNSVVFRMAWFELQPEGFEGRFHEHVSLIAYGDDNAMNVSDVACEFFNHAALCDTLAHYGLTYTDENKSNVSYKYRPLANITFLKRSWRYEPQVGRFVAPLDFKTLRESPYWTKKGPDRYQNTVANFDAQLGELSLHGSEVYAQYASEMLEAARRKLKHYPEITEWSELLSFTLGQDHLLIA